MADQLAQALARLITLCPFVQSIHDLATKQRVVLEGGYLLDLYFNETLGKYSYTLVQGARRIIGWDNASHHPGLANFPHHFHRQDGVVVSSPLTGNPKQDIELVVADLNEFLDHHL
jgi:hypothetical protein